ncbi:MAG: SCO family protein [Candidatus Thiodiazotropha taylori]|nr:SCO family protein [Candidatus Thiodiazotropha taylori]MCG8105717.1 SCO family protein [Candidatus Thiodiazotropha taylori]MCG8113137.1 SCO family protein [Candidatus Thiodiazotropha taylori]MCW4278054.1 SCO family protein [Candidatus Thiodiazotropha taylori]MCW4285496.1 SCO family protein [Candidatus Thiodiazotropha taylori]
MTQSDKKLWLVLLFTLLSVTMASAATDEIGGDFMLTDHNNDTFRLSQLRGKLVMLSFGYTYCPDICPTELAKLAVVFDTLKEQSDRLQGLFVSLDPDRDTPAVLSDYVDYFNSEFVGLTGTETAVDEVARQYRVKYQRNHKDGGAYSIDHSANLYLIDRKGALAAVIPYGMPVEHIVDVVRGMLSGDG